MAIVFTAASPEVAHFGNESIDCCEISRKKFNKSNVLDSNGQAQLTPRVNPLFLSTINHEELFSEKLTETD